MKSQKKHKRIFFYFSPIHRILFVFLEQGGITVSFLTEPYKLHEGPTHLPTDWFEQKIIGLELGCTKIRTSVEFNYSLDIVS